MVKTKIVCTIGPASSSASVLRQMIRAGMDVARLNFSHGTHAGHQHRIDLIRQLNKRMRRRVRILQDLQGYRIRVGRFKGGKEIELKKRQSIALTNENVLGDRNVIPFDYRGELSDIEMGSHIYIDDGTIALEVRSATQRYLKARVVVPGVVREHKGINMPDVRLRFEGLTPKDEKDIQFGVENRVDYVAQSFVRNADDVEQVRELVKPSLAHCKIIAKIENREGIRNIDDIIKVADGIMIARGDMGVSIPIYEIPIVQKEVIKKCNKARKFVITATQMLESMVEHLRPTRAEVTDVANAILDGTDFVMLSEETAAGRHPAEAVKMMNQIIKFTEANRDAL